MYVTLALLQQMTVEDFRINCVSLFHRFFFLSLIIAITFEKLNRIDLTRERDKEK